jgi:hypothetical protein
MYLVFAANGRCVEVVSRKPKGVKINRARKTWTYEHAHHRQPEPIGQGCYLGHRRGGVIGVYDRDNLRHISSMANDAIKSQRDESEVD